MQHSIPFIRVRLLSLKVYCTTVNVWHTIINYLFFSFQVLLDMTKAERKSSAARDAAQRAYDAAAQARDLSAGAADRADGVAEEISDFRGDGERATPEDVKREAESVSDE